MHSPIVGRPNSPRHRPLMPSCESVSIRKPHVLVFIVAYHAETTIASVLDRIPALAGYETEVLVIDDGSLDRTFAISEGIRCHQACRHPLTVLANPVNQGYGGNQKIGYHYAICHGFDFVALVHGDGQYPPELLPEMLVPLSSGEAEVVHGSRMLPPRQALRGGCCLCPLRGDFSRVDVGNSTDKPR